ncbi:TPA: YadA-like family protein [Proteus mirabilis]|uniref:YadA-like family protein n=2 Tax=Proteus mirabilis TaxID=584 RepID=UPI00066780AE|nr:YadA-like family protein [Proteus mirabilis]ELA9917916.1 YadA-like family protein [Proteus mirabilis]MBI6260241.1 YadA-like family protein [Proteus mirabilis]HCR4068499.1 YadA-like family protein [Proteus mirabilis]HEK0975983.1 YadA-like family protein [Proteus mirabilis]HEK1815643.1 YadA-like family protein [Proteus mirabilis]
MNYNKLFLISFSLIYSANVFSNTDSPSPMDNLSPSMTFSPPVISPSPLPTGNPSQLGNGSMVESSIDIPPTLTTHLPQPPLMPHLPQPPLMGYRAPTIGNTSGYRTQFPNTDANPIKTIKAIKTYLDMTDHATDYHSKLIGEYISAFISISRPSTSTSSENILVSLSKPFFDHMSKAIDVDSDEDGSMLVDKSKKDIARTMSSYLESLEAGFLETMNDENTSEIRLTQMALLHQIQDFKNIVDESIEKGTSFTIVANQDLETAEPLTEIQMITKRLSQPVTRVDIANAYVLLSGKIDNEVGAIANQQQITTETLTLQDNKITKVESDVKKNEGNIAVNREGITKVESIVEKNKEDIQTNREDINKVKETAGKNKIYVDKYLANDFDVNEQSKSLVGHLGSLYAGNKLNTDNINAIRNDLSHFKNETNNRFYKVEKRANQGIASVAAMSNLPFNDAATFSTAMGIGNYRNATAFAWGMQYRINENVKVKASTAWNDANNWVSAGGIGISW